MADERDDDEDTKSSKGPKKRFQERDESDEEDDRPKKKRRRDEDAEDEDDRPRSKRKADDTDDEDDNRPKKKKAYDEDEEDDRPKKKRRVADDGPRVKSNDNIPVLMLLAFIGSALALFLSCVGCGWFSFDWLVGGGSGGGGGGGWGNEMEVVAASRTPAARAFDGPNVSWTVRSLQNSSGGGQYYVVMKCGNQMSSELIAPDRKGWSMTSGHPRIELKGTAGKTEVWVEKRPNPVATGKVVSNVFVIP